MKNIFISGVKSEKSKYCLYVEGLENSKVKDVFISDCKFDGVKDGSKILNAENISMKEIYINGKLEK